MQSAPDPVEPANVPEPTLSTEPIAIAAMTLVELRLLADALTLEEAEEPAFLATTKMPRMSGKRFFVYEDLDDLELGQRCTALRGSEDKDSGELWLRVNGPRNAAGLRQYHEIVLREGIAQTSGGSEGPGFANAFGGFLPLDFTLARADAQHRIYVARAENRQLACQPQSRRVACPDGGVASCTVAMPVVVSTSSSPVVDVGSFRGATVQGVGHVDLRGCSIACEKNPCEVAIGAPSHRAIRTVFRADAATVGVFGSRAACRAYARERAPLLELVAAVYGACDCASCADDECVARCEDACETRNQSVIDAAPEVLASSAPQLRLVSIARITPIVAKHRHQAAQISVGYRDCLQRALDEHAGPLEPEVARHQITLAVLPTGRIANHKIEGDALRETLGVSLDKCLLAATAQSMPATTDETSFSLSTRIVIGPR